VSTHNLQHLDVGTKTKQKSETQTLCFCVFFTLTLHSTQQHVKHAIQSKKKKGNQEEEEKEEEEEKKKNADFAELLYHPDCNTLGV
jgi:hypothetical protein